jgi:hypothetical protein
LAGKHPLARENVTAKPGTKKMTKLDYLFKQYETVLGWYKQIEEKAKSIVSVNTLAVGVVNGPVFIAADKVRAARSLYTMPIWVLLALSDLALIASYLFVLRALCPHGQLRNKILNKIQKKGEIAHRHLYHSINSGICSKKEFDSIIEVLGEGGIINVRKELPPAGGRPKLFYSMG